MKKVECNCTVQLAGGVRLEHTKLHMLCLMMCNICCKQVQLWWGALASAPDKQGLKLGARGNQNLGADVIQVAVAAVLPGCRLKQEAQKYLLVPVAAVGRVSPPALDELTD